MAGGERERNETMSFFGKRFGKKPAAGGPAAGSAATAAVGRPANSDPAKDPNLIRVVDARIWRPCPPRLEL